MTATVTILTVVFSIAAKIAIAHQIVMNHRRQSVSGMSVPFFLTGMLGYCFWVLSGIVTHSWVLIAGQSLGVLLTFVIAVQVLMFWVKKRRE